MSINVNVTGNPVSIRRGQMFMSDIESFKKKETQRRRKARLEQVRQQSKDIASDIRDRKKKNQSHLLGNYEIAQDAALKKWSAKKLLNLQQQYNECLENLGNAHRAASSEQSPEEVLAKQRHLNSTKAKQRGKKALDKLYEYKTAEDLKVKTPKCRKLMSRQFENMRANMVSQLSDKKRIKKKKKRNRKNEANTSQENQECICSDPEDDSQNINPNAFHLASVRETQNVNPDTFRLNSAQEKCRQDMNIEYICPNKQQFNFDACDCCPKNFIPGHDTRLSSLIKRRLEIEAHEGPLESDKNRCQYNPADYIMSSVPSPPIEPRPRKISSSNIPPEPIVLEAMDLTEDSALKSNELKDIENPPVQYYNHTNRYTGTYIPKNDLVKKNAVYTDKSVSCPTEEDQKRFRNLAKQRAQMAQRRGREALRKEQIKNDCKNLMKELSNVHKEEQLLKTYTRSNLEHLSETRLKVAANKRERKLEEAFNSYTHSIPLITIEPVEEYQRIEGRNLPEHPKMSLNVAEWDIPSENLNSNDDSTESLQNLLKRVSNQRALLKNEIAKFQPVCQLTTSRSNSTQKSKKGKSTVIDIDVEETSDSDHPLFDQINVNVKETNSVEVQLKKEGETKQRCYENIPNRKFATRTKVTRHPGESSRSSKTCDIKKTIPDSAGTSGTIKVAKNKKSSSGTKPSAESSKTFRTHKVTKSISKSDTEIKESKQLCKCSQQSRALSADSEQTRISAGGSELVSQSLQLEPKQTVTNNESETSRRTSSTSGDVQIFVKDKKHNLMPEHPSGIQIIIKVNDKSNSLSVNDKPKSSKAISTSPERQSVEQTKWINSFQKNYEVKETSTSTSYLSPPEIFLKAYTSPLVEEMKLKETSEKCSIDTKSKMETKLSPRTKQLIQKLLAMSRTSIDHLEVSSSDVHTPDLAIVQTTENLVQINSSETSDVDESLLQEVFKMQKNLSNTSSMKSTPSLEQIIPSPSIENVISNESCPSRTPEEIDTSSGYSNLAAFCAKRIDRLTEMIQKVRADTQKLHKLAPSNENTAETTYLNLPDNQPGPESSDQSSDSKKKVASLFKNLLQTDHIQTNVELDGELDNILNQQGPVFTQPLSQQQTNIYPRMPKRPIVLTDNGYPSSSIQSNGETNNRDLIVDPKYSSNESENIKKPSQYKKRPPSTSFKYSEDLVKEIPAKELSTIIENSRTVSDQLDTLMQNLQTVQLDLKLDSKQSSISDSKSDEIFKPSTSKPITVKNDSKRSSSKPTTKQDKKMVLEQVSINSDSYSRNISSIHEILIEEPQPAEVIPPGGGGNSASSSDSLDDALKQLGLGWAITTLRKTKQTLELSSTSASSESNSTSTRSVNSLKRNVNLSELLRRQHQKRYLIESTSTVESIEITPEIRKLLDYIPSTSKLTKHILAQIQNSIESENSSQSLTRGRTSTPVLQKFPNLFVNSDISIIKKPTAGQNSSSNSNINLTVPNISLDISKTLGQKSDSSSS